MMQPHPSAPSVARPSRNVFLTHLFFCSLFLVVPILVFMRQPGERAFTLTRPFVQDMIANAILLGFFYINYYVLIPRYYFTHRYLKYILYLLLCLSFVLWVPHALITPLRDSLPDHPPGLQGPPMIDDRPFLYFVWDEFRRHLYLFFTAIFFSLLLRIREHLDQVREEKLVAELASLRAQINPHFLFNTLNSIYTLSVKKDERVSEAILQLSGIMRYAIRDARDTRIPLRQEIDYICNYIGLQRARLGDTATILFDCTGPAGGLTIAPLLLITYIENAFKYGINPDAPDSRVEIHLTVTGSGIQLRTFNNKAVDSHQPVSTGIGMDNTRDRLQYLYPGKHSLHIGDTAETYSVTLTLELT